MVIHRFIEEEHIGDTLLYRLKLRQDNPATPTEALRLWRGRIIRILIDSADRSQDRYYLVQVLEPGFEGCEEVIFPFQVAGFEPPFVEPGTSS